jgi:hypothetical protein
MKKLHIVSVLTFFALVGAPVFANGIEFKAGAASVKGASDKVGFDSGIGYAIRLDRFFAVMPEVNFHWLSYETSNTSLGAGGAAATTTAVTTSFYTVPAMLNGRIYIPMGTDDVPVFQPYITLGAGYGWTGDSFSRIGVYKGFMYQAYLGGLLNLGMVAEGSASSTSVLFEVGYRGGLLGDASGTNKVDFGGWSARVGISLSM